MNTDHVLEVIDHTLDDFATSPDAMRCTPEPVPGPQVTPPVWVAWRTPVVVTERDVRTFREGVERAVEPFARYIRDNFAEISRAVAAIEAEPDDKPADPRQRALDARRNRNTGPDRSTYRHRGQR